MSGGDGGTTARTFRMPLSCALKNGRDGTFYIMGILPQQSDNAEGEQNGPDLLQLSE